MRQIDEDIRDFRRFLAEIHSRDDVRFILLLGEARRLGLGVVVGHTDEDAHPGADLPDALSGLALDHVDMGLADPLH